MIPSIFRELKHLSGPLWYDDMIWWLTRERAYDNNIRRVLKYFQKQRLWWEHRNILETAQSHCVEERPPQSFAELSKQALVESTIVSDFTRWNVTFFCAAFFLKISDIISSHQKDALLDKKSVSRWLRIVGFSHSPRISFFLSLQRQSRASPTLTARATPELLSCFTKSVSGDLFVD